MWIICSRDPLFFVNAFCWTYDPRRKPSAIPFITYEYQDAAILDLIDCIDQGRDCVMFKTRDMGASWIGCMVFLWMFLYRELVTFLMMSRKETLVDKAGDPKCLFAKIDFSLERLPGWLVPNYERQKLHLINLDNRSTIDGESTGQDSGRGDRRTAVFLDEFASVENGDEILSATADTTPCRIFNSTPKGRNHFWRVCQNEDILKIRMHWTQHPLKASGLWYDDQGRPRSPWYDAECKRRFHPAQIAQELDIDFLSSDYLFFDAAGIEAILREEVREPLLVGHINLDDVGERVVSISPSHSGHLRLWTVLESGRPQKEREYVLGVDVATGTGSSNSVIAIADRATREKVAEFASASVRPHELARYAVALAHWFNDGLLIWEANGPGRNFGDGVIDTGYRNIFWREADRSLFKKTSDVPGWYSTRESKLSLLGEYRRALLNREYINRSYDAVKECEDYVFLANGTVAHSKSAKGDDPTGARENHGDRVVADALVWKMIRAEVAKPKEKPKLNILSLAGRREETKRRKAKTSSW